MRRGLFTKVSILKVINRLKKAGASEELISLALGNTGINKEADKPIIMPRKVKARIEGQLSIDRRCGVYLTKRNKFRIVPGSRMSVKFNFNDPEIQKKAVAASQRFFK